MRFTFFRTLLLLGAMASLTGCLDEGSDAAEAFVESPGDASEILTPPGNQATAGETEPSPAPEPMDVPDHAPGQPGEPAGEEPAGEAPPPLEEEASGTESTPPADTSTETRVVFVRQVRSWPDTDEPEPDQDPAEEDEAPAPRLVGAVVKGIAVNAVVTVLGFDATGATTLLGTTATDSQGAYALELPNGYEGVVQLLISASTDPENPTRLRCDASPDCGMRTDDGADDTNLNGVVDFGELYPAGEDFGLRAVAVVSGGGPRILNVTPLSTLASDWAETFPQGLDPLSVMAANAQAAALFGFSLEALDGAINDIADPLWVNLANPEQLRFSLMLATFSQIASAYGLTPQYVIGEVSKWFVGQQGRLQQIGGDPGEPTLDMFLDASLLLAGVVEMPPATHEEVTQALRNARDALEWGVLSAPLSPAIAFDSVLEKLGPMGDQIDELLAITGLRDPVAVANAQLPYYDWLFTPDNINILPVAIETVAHAVMGSAFLDMSAMPDELKLVDDGISTVTIHKQSKQLRVLGLRHGQQVDITIDLTPLRSGLVAKNLTYVLEGSSANAGASGVVSGTLRIDLAGTDTDSLVEAIDALTQDESLFEDKLRTAFQDMAYGMKVRVDVDGSARLVRNSDTAQQIGIAGALTGTLDLGALPGQTIATLDVPAGEVFLPTGDRFYGLPGMPILTVVVGDDSTLVLDGGATLSSLNLPEATAHVSGTLVNSRALFEHIRGTLVDQFSDGIPELGGLVTALLDFDLGQLAINGEGEVLIPALGHQYRASLDNLTGTLYQPYSTEIAATARLDIDAQAVRMQLGDEPWSLRVLTTPTPRVLLLGPEGQFAEATQEDLVDFLSALPFAELFAGFFGGTGDSSSGEPVPGEEPFASY